MLKVFGILVFHMQIMLKLQFSDLKRRFLDTFILLLLKHRLLIQSKLHHLSQLIAHLLEVVSILLEAKVFHQSSLKTQQIIISKFVDKLVQLIQLSQLQLKQNAEFLPCQPNTQMQIS